MILFLEFYLHEEAMNCGYKMKVHWQGHSCGRTRGTTALSSNMLGILNSEQLLFAGKNQLFCVFKLFFNKKTRKYTRKKENMEKVQKIYILQCPVFVSHCL